MLTIMIERPVYREIRYTILRAGESQGLIFYFIFGIYLPTYARSSRINNGSSSDEIPALSASKLTLYPVVR